MIDTPEKLAIHLLGQERYDHSPCQAHPYELIVSYVEELRREKENMGTRLEMEVCAEEKVTLRAEIDSLNRSLLVHMEAYLDEAEKSKRLKSDLRDADAAMCQARDERYLCEQALREKDAQIDRLQERLTSTTNRLALSLQEAGRLKAFNAED